MSLAWVVEYDPRALKDLRKLGRTAQSKILDYMDDRVVNADDPRQSGKPLRGSLFKLWRYRVGDYRIICEIQDNRMVVLVVGAGHRSSVYKA